MCPVGLATVNLVHGGAGLLLYPVMIALGFFADGGSARLHAPASGLGVLVSLRAASVRQAQQTFTITYFVLFIPILVFPMLPSSVTQNMNYFLMGHILPPWRLGQEWQSLYWTVLRTPAAMGRFKRSRLILTDGFGKYLAFL